MTLPGGGLGAGGLRGHRGHRASPSALEGRRGAPKGQLRTGVGGPAVWAQRVNLGPGWARRVTWGRHGRAAVWLGRGPECGRCPERGRAASTCFRSRRRRRWPGEGCKRCARSCGHAIGGGSSSHALDRRKWPIGRLSATRKCDRSCDRRPLSPTFACDSRRRHPGGGSGCGRVAETKERPPRARDEAER